MKNLFLNKNKSIMFTDLTIIALILYIMIYSTYQPYFFGDELNIYYNTISSQGSVFQNFLISNEYKPRLIFNFIWALISETTINRYFPSLVEYVSLLMINVIIYIFTIIYIKLDRKTTYIIILSIILSRYGIMLYYDYVSGIIGLLSTLFLLMSLYYVYLVSTIKSSKLYYFYAFLFANMAAITYETTIAVIFSIGIYRLIILILFTRIKSKKQIFYWILYTISPVILFYILTIIFSNHSILMGTAGQKVGISIDTAITFCTYIYNILGGNYGHDWFWGIYNYQHPIGKYIGFFTFITTVLIISLSFYKKAIYTERNTLVIGLIISILSVLAIASLPGSIRQEARWLYPAGILILILYAVYFKGFFRTALLLTVLVTNIFYFFTNSYYSIANVVASKSAKSLAYSIEHLNLTDNMNCAVIGFGDNNWIIGKDTIFSKINFNGGYNIEYIDNKYNKNLNEFNCILKFDGFDTTHSAKYKLVSQDILLIESGQRKISDLETDLKISKSEDFDKFKGYIEKVDYGIVLKPQKDAFIELSLNELKNKMLVYKANSVNSFISVPMRLQINWLDDERKFISAQIKVVDVNKTLAYFGMIVSAPKNAKYGLIYATLHDGANSDVILESIELRKIK